MSVLAICAAVSFAQTNATNQTNCDVEVWVLCYDANCNYQSETMYVVPAGATVQIPDCPPPSITEFFVRWENAACRGAGTQVGGSCNPLSGTFGDFCNCTVNGFATVNWSPGVLDILP